MAEMLAGFSNEPNPSLINVYDQWAKGNWGAVLTGLLPPPLAQPKVPPYKKAFTDST